MSLLKDVLALFRGNVICIMRKLLYGSRFSYYPFIRLFAKAEIRIRKKGIVHIGKNAKIDSYAILACNGGKIFIGNRVGIGRNNVVVSQKDISIGDGTILGPNVLIYDHDHLFDCKTGVKIDQYSQEAVSIGKNCWIGANTIILKGTVIGDNCLIAAGSVIKGNYPSGSKIVQKRNTFLLGGNEL